MRQIGRTFKGEMVCAILENRKWNTRRIMKPQPTNPGFSGKLEHVTSSRPYSVGDLIWVREKAKLRSVHGGKSINDRSFTILYAADDEIIEFPNGNIGPYKFNKWTPSIHMPRWASRLTLEITDVRVERLQEINNDGAIAEGIVEIQRSAFKHGLLNGYGIQGTPPDEAQSTRVYAFATLWNSIHGPGAWDLNPYVWVLTFRKVKP